VPFPQLDEYDMMVRELGFEMKAQPSEKLKTPEEQAREERARLQTLEVCIIIIIIIIICTVTGNTGTITALKGLSFLLQE